MAKDTRKLQRSRLKKLSGKICMRDNWRALEETELKASRRLLKLKLASGGR
jgi:hypothetical protein